MAGSNAGGTAKGQSRQHQRRHAIPVERPIAPIHALVNETLLNRQNGASLTKQWNSGVSMILYYRERNGDLLAIDTTTNSYYRTVFGQDHFEGRATAIAAIVSSVCT